MSESIKAGRRRVEVSNPRKALFPSGIAKRDLARYYADVAAAMVPHVRGRPVAMERYPDGIEAGGFLQKSVPEHFPDWIRTTEVARQRGGPAENAVLCDAATLVYLADQACITPHAWLSRADRIDRPDRMIFDLDPSDGDFAGVCRAARALGGMLRDLGLEPYPMTTGSRGIHVTVPLRRTAGFDRVRDFARGVAEQAVERDPEGLTLEARKEKRGGRILVDIMRNAYAQLAVPPYAVRARPGAPVAMPLAWEEVEDPGLRPDGWDLRSAVDRLERGGDRWEGMSRQARSLPAAAR